MRRVPRFLPLTSALVTVVLTFGLVATAYANNILPWRLKGDQVILYDSFGLTTISHTSLHDTANNNMNPTDLVPQHFHETIMEVYLYDGDYGDTGWVGLETCLNLVAGNCGSVTVQLNLHWGAFSQVESDSIMCEEVGHAFGLDHKADAENDSCMDRPVVNTRRWDPHDRGLINGWY